MVGGASIGGAEIAKATRPSQAQIYAEAGIEPGSCEGKIKHGFTKSLVDGVHWSVWLRGACASVCKRMLSGD